jgi:hypothetical protein
VDNKIIEHRSKETAEVLGSIPGWILRWGSLVMTAIVSFVIISSIQLIHFTYKFSTNGQVGSESITFNKTLNSDIDKIEYILVGDQKPVRIDDLDIVTTEKNIIIKFSSNHLDSLNVKNNVKIEVFQKKSLLEIIVGDIN